MTYRKYIKKIMITIASCCGWNINVRVLESYLFSLDMFEFPVAAHCIYSFKIVKKRQSTHS